jgi:signal peptidase II
MNLRALAPYAVLVAAFVVLDQWVKQIVEATLPMQELVEVLPSWLSIAPIIPASPSSMFSFIGDKGLILVSLAVIAFVLYLASRTAAGHVLARIGFALIIGGAVGNIIDRSVFGHVIDYVLFHTPVWSFAVFNLADAFITVGAVFVIADEFSVRCLAESDHRE